MKLRTLALALALPLAACGGSDTPSETPASTARVPSAEPTPPSSDGAGHAHGEQHAKLPPELDSFHEALAPRWHAAAGPARTRDACAAVPDFRTRADLVKGAAAPAGAAAADWAQAGERLVASVVGLDEACKSNDAAKIEPAFSALHDAFHRAMELAMGGHGHGEGHGEGHGHGHGHGHKHGEGHGHEHGDGHGAPQPAPAKPN